MHYIPQKGWFDTSGKKVGSMRKIQIELARIAGFENNNEAFTRLVIESQVSRQTLTEAFRQGRAKANYV